MKPLSEYQKFKNRYGTIIITLSYITLMVIAYYTIAYSKELATHPLQYVQEKYDLIYCMGEEYTFSFNESGVWVEENVLGGWG